MYCIRKAEYVDMNRLSFIMVTSFRTAFADFVSKETMDTCANPENCRRMLENICLEGKVRFLTDGENGFAAWQETECGAEIIAVHSMPETWGTGLGHAMITRVLEDIGGEKVFLWVFSENVRARRFYEKHGFAWDGTQRVSDFDGATEMRYIREKQN